MSREIGAQSWPGTGKIFPQAPHAWDFMVYAYLQLGQDAKAKALVEEMNVAQRASIRTSAFIPAMVAVPARYYLERQDWSGAAQLQPLGAAYPAALAARHSDAISISAAQWARRASATSPAPTATRRS